MTLLEQINQFLEKHAMEASRFGVLAINDGHLVFDLARGRKLRRATVRKIEDFMEQANGKAAFLSCSSSATS